MDLLVHSYNYAHYRNIYKMIPGGKDWYTHVYSPEIIKADIQEAFASSFDDKKFTCLDHHLSHAASAYYCSHYENALIIVADGMGELKGVSIYLAKDNEINILHSINFNNSIGILYSLLTFHMGFDFNADEYKTMGLAPYGNPEKYLPILEKWVHYDENNGSFSLSFIQHEPDQFSRETYANTRKFLSEQLFEARHPDHDLNQNHKDLAASLQVITNRIMCYLARHWMKKTKQTHLCMAGGVALNCVANEKVLELEEVHHLFVQPAAGDDGAALGAAMYFASKEDPIEKLEQPYIGPNLDIEEASHVFYNFEIKTDYKKYHHNSESDAAMYIAELLAKGKIIGLYQGRMEFGPRALGNRSIR
jgi:carbamoyltransferase